jgi:hypothetical protein
LNFAYHAYAELATTYGTFSRTIPRVFITASIFPRGNSRSVQDCKSFSREIPLGQERSRPSSRHQIFSKRSSSGPIIYSQEHSKSSSTVKVAQPEHSRSFQAHFKHRQGSVTIFTRALKYSLSSLTTYSQDHSSSF